MSTLLATSEEASGVRRARAGALAQVCRTPCYLPSQGQALFACLHRSREGQSSTHGVLICPPVGYEQIHAHRSLRHLADDLAAAGFLACRLDYHGTGDSPGRDEDSDRCDTWQTNIRDAIRWLHDAHGCTQVSVIGVRLGALLALEVSGDSPVTDLILWAPVIKGRTYVREMQALAIAGGAELTDDSDLEAAGFVLTRQTADDLMRLDALDARPLCRRALVVARDDLMEDRRLVEHLGKFGVPAEQIRQPGYADMMAEPHQTKVPRQAIASMVDWLAAASLPTPCEDPDADFATAMNLTAGIRERIVEIPGEPELIGIATEPERDDPAVPTIVLANAGAAYRVGPNRLSVALARRLASRGFRCVRIDLAGLGDSVAPGATKENDSYGAELFPAVDRALRHLETEFGVRHVVLAGLCSGAYVAFQAAAQFENPALVESILINPLTFFWKDGMTIEAPDSAEFARFHYYSRSALQPSKWLKLLTGKSRIGLLGAMKMLAWRWRPRKSRPVSAGDLCVCGHDAHVGHPPRENLASDLRHIAASGRRLACFFSREDPGASLLMFHARRAVKALCKAGKMNLFFIDNADHTFSKRQPRETAVSAVVEYLAERYRNSDPHHRDTEAQRRNEERKTENRE